MKNMWDKEPGIKDITKEIRINWDADNNPEDP